MDGEGEEVIYFIILVFDGGRDFLVGKWSGVEMNGGDEQVYFALSTQ